VRLVGIKCVDGEEDVLVPGAHGVRRRVHVLDVAVLWREDGSRSQIVGVDAVEVGEDIGPGPFAGPVPVREVDEVLGGGIQVNTRKQLKKKDGT